jgi:predicted transcriptional regulator
MRNYGFIQSIPNVKDYVSLYSGPWNERIDDYIELEELVDKIVAENTQQEVDKDEEG